jgi:FimV-like protein
VAAGRAAARKLAGSVLSILQHLNSAGESAMRLSVFESVRTAPGYSEDDAASAAKNSTVNFNRRGEWGPVMGALYLFFNPGIQGTAAIMDTLAMVLTNEKQFPRALQLQKEVVAKMPNVPGFRLHLAQIYLDSGDKKSARTELEQLSKLGKDFGGQEEVSKLLKQAGES